MCGYLISRVGCSCACLITQGKGHPGAFQGAGEKLGIVLVCIQSCPIHHAVCWLVFAEPALINYQLIWRGWGVQGGAWAVGGRFFLINGIYRSEKTLLRVIKVNLYWHSTGCLLKERRRGCSCGWTRGRWVCWLQTAEPHRFSLLASTGDRISNWFLA